jgi:hypothetical protein
MKDLKNIVTIEGIAHSVTITPCKNGTTTMIKTVVSVTSPEGKSFLVPTIFFGKNDSKILSMARQTLDNMTTIVTAEDPKSADNIRIQGELGVDLKGELQITAKFFNKKDKGDDLIGIIFDVEGVYKSCIPDEKIESLYNLSLQHLGYNDRLSNITISVDLKKASAIKEHYAKGDTVNIVGRVDIIEKITTFKQEMLLGEPIEKTKVERKYLALLENGSAPYKGDDAVSEERVLKAMAAAKEYADKRKQQTTQTPVSFFS